MSTTRIQKVLKLRILKPTEELSWQDFARLLYDVRYRVFRLANLAVSEAYLNFHLFRTKRVAEYKTSTIGTLNRQLREMLLEEKVLPEYQDHFSKTGALPDMVVSALSQYKLQGLLKAAKWKQVIRGQTSLPTFRNNMAIPIRCDKSDHPRLQKKENGDITLQLRCCCAPHPTVVLQTGKIGGSAEATLKKLLDNPEQQQSGYRQRCLEIKHDERENKWWLYLTYDFPYVQNVKLSPERVVGVDLGYGCPLYAAISNGHARLGRRQFTSLMARIRSLQTQIMSRRRNMLSGGKSELTKETARGGHGRKRLLKPIEVLAGRINSAYTTLNHQLAKAVIEFASANGAGLIQIEDLKGLQEELTGTFLGARWRYFELQSFLANKAKEAGIELRSVNPKYTSRRCSECGYIHKEFSRSFRDSHSSPGLVTRFVCPKCEYTSDPDYNAARNIATLDIAQIIVRRCEVQESASSLTIQT